jgi:hypothetical protein
MTTLAQQYGGSASLTLNSSAWTTGATISSNALNISTLSPIPDDILMTVSFAIPAGTLASSPQVNVWFAISEDGTHYSDNDQYGGANNTQSSLRTPSNFYGPFVIYCPSASITAYGVISSVASILNGVLPRNIGVILQNQTGLTLTSPTVTYSPINYTNS